MQLKRGAALVALVAVSAVSGASRAETPEQWIELGARVHGGFGAFIPAGIRIGLDALTRLKAEPRQVTVAFTSGEKAPCPCIADGVMIATQASPGLPGPVVGLSDALGAQVIHDGAEGGAEARAGVRCAVQAA